MNIRIKRLLTGVVGALTLLGVGIAEARDLKLAMQTNPGTAQYDGVEKFAALVKDKSGGKLNVKIFGGGALGGDLQTVSSLQGGIIDMSVMNASLLNGISKEFSFLDFPFLFNSNAEAYAIVDGPIGKRLMDKLPAKNLVGLAYPELGFRHISNGKRPINKLEDLQGLKIRVIQTPVYVEMMNALGANATPLPFPEVYGALETRAVDGATNPLVTLQVQKFYEVQKYLTLTRHQYNPQIMIVSKKTWDSLPPADQKILQDAAIEARDFERKVSREKEAQALEYLKQHLQVNELPASEVARARERLKPVIDKYTKEVGEDLMNEVNAELARMRSGK